MKPTTRLTVFGWALMVIGMVFYLLALWVMSVPIGFGAGVIAGMGIGAFWVLKA